MDVSWNCDVKSGYRDTCIRSYIVAKRRDYLITTDLIRFVKK